jgi:hypothetical protein
MYTYTLVANSTSILRSDGATIPNCPGNSDYAAYLKWVAAGNVVTPVPGPTLAQAQATQAGILNAATSNEIYKGFTSSALGTVHTYPAQQLDQLNMNSRASAATIALTSPAWAAGAVVPEGQIITMDGQGFICTTPGTSSTSPQNWSVAPVDDGSVIWNVWTVSFWCQDSTGAWTWAAHTASQMRQVGIDGNNKIGAILQQNSNLQQQVQAVTVTTTEADAVAAVQAIVWPSA